MSTSQMPSTGTGLRFRLFGIPVSIGPSIVLVLAFFGLGIGGPVEIAMWVVIGIGSILVHELGHALVARAAGSEPEIRLAGLGGLTRHSTTGRGGQRRWRLAISLAGPLVGLAVGGAVLALRASGVEGEGYVRSALQILLFTSLGWSIFNLLPILPLDGGQALRELLPGNPQERTVRAGWIGLVTSVALIAGAVWLNQVFIAVFGGLFATQNYRIATAARTAEREQEQLRLLLGNRDFRSLRDALADGRGDHALAEAAQVGAAEHGEHQLAAEIGEVVMRRGTNDPRFAARAAVAWRELGMHDRAAQVAARGDGGPPPPAPDTEG